MTSVARLVGWAGVLATVAGLCGCSSQRVHPVKGRITFEGKPMSGGGSIAFVPTGNQAGKTAGGTIAADGTYYLTTDRDGDGSMPGEFRVVITQVVEREPDRSNDGEKAGKPVAVVGPGDRIPAVYSDPYQSPLRATVEAKRLNELNFDLKRAPGNARGQGRGDAVASAR